MSTATLTRALQSPAFLKMSVSLIAVLFVAIYVVSFAIAVLGTDQQWSHLKAWMELSMPLALCTIILALLCHLRETEH